MLRRVPRFPFVLVLLAAGLAASAALLVDYTTSSPVFCADGGGCDALRRTAIAHPFGIPLPALGLAGFLLLGVLALTRGARVRQANALASGVAGVVGVLLLGVQLFTQHLCPYCAVVDTSVVLLALLAWERLRFEADPPKGPLASLVTSGTLAAALTAPFLWAQHQASKVPDVIAEELAKTPPGAVTVVDFVDFECPFCRQMQTKIAPLLAAQKEKVHLVRKMVPLTRIHPHALAAARAACCGEVLGKGDAMADALFASKVDDLTPEGCTKIAESLGLPRDKYDACLASPETDARLARDRHEFDQAAVKGDGLPLMWVGTHKMMGAKDDATVARALGDAIARAGS